jgi:hypothetical protein
MVEPWISPDAFDAGSVDLLTVAEPDLTIARASYADREGDVSRVRFEFLVSERDKGIRHFTETHEMGLFAPDMYVAAFVSAGLDNVEHDPEGLMGRGLIIGSAPA